MKISQILKNNLSCDSRVLKKGEIFFDLLSNKNQINPFIKNIIAKKPKLIISSIKLDYKKIKIKKNVKKFYYTIIKKKFPNIPSDLSAVTGTNGKTSVANFFFQINRLNKIPCANIGTLGYFYNNKYIPSSLTTPDIYKIYEFLNLIKKNKINKVILEASSHGLNQGRLYGLRFKNSAFTNFSQDHLDYHKSMKSYLNAKLILFKKLLKKRANIICDDKIKKILLNNGVPNKKYKFIMQSKRKFPFKIISNKAIDSKINVKINHENVIYSLSLNLIGDFQLKNLLQAIALSVSSGLNFKKIIKVLPQIKPIKGRLNIFKKNNKIVCLDYAHTPDGLEKTIKTLKQHFRKDVNIVFGCGGNRDIGKRKKMGKIVNNLCKDVIITDDNPRHENPVKICKQIQSAVKKAKIINDRKTAIKKGIKITGNNAVLLVAGKGHESYQLYKNIKIPFSDQKVIKESL